ncbi:hypothetical protein [Geodermatophilus sp. SYSU D01105]
MTTVVVPGRPRSTSWAGAGPAGRGAALLALASAAVHLTGVSTASLSSLAMAGMALACLPCAWHLWRAPSPAVWATTVGLDLGMLAVHAPAASGDGGHAHGAALPAAGLWLVGASLLLGLAVLLALTVRAAAGRLPPAADREETPRP